MSSIKAAGLICGMEEEHYLDHIAPIAVLLGIPLIVTDPKIKDLASKHYPQISIHSCYYPEIGEKIVKEYDVIFSCLPKALFDQIVFIPEQLYQKKVLNIWCPHGNSDKGHSSCFIEGLSKETIVLVYGKKMVDFLIEKNAYSQLYALIKVGNYRYYYYKSYVTFYNNLVKKEISLKLKKKAPTLLYAPTWNDAEKSSSFFTSCDPLIKALPDNWNLIIKPHPHTLKQTQLLTKWSDKENLLILKDFPSIYPLLNFVDVYLGDASSIGYDFLTFQKPMYFLNPNNRNPETDKGLYLHRCGETIKENFNKVFSLNYSDSYNKIQKEVYSQVFGFEKNIKATIINTYERYLS